MTFYKQTDHTQFCMYVSSDPLHAFSVFAKGYKSAAEKLTKSLIADGRFSDYEAYPAIFLYRHALELHLKNIIYQSARLVSLREFEALKIILRNHHKLVPLAREARVVVMELFPSDLMLSDVMAQLQNVCRELELIDPDSFAFRYPIDTAGNESSATGRSISLEAFSTHLSRLIDNLDTIDFGLGIEIYRAEDAINIHVESLEGIVERLSAS